MNKEAIQRLIESTVNTTTVVVESEDNIHFYVTVVADEFEGKSKIQQHKMIMDLFRQSLADETIHALSLKTYTPEKWQALQKESNHQNGGN